MQANHATARGVDSSGAVCRWMGNVRFTLGAVQQILQGKTHHARIAVLPYQHADTMLHDPSAPAPSEGLAKYAFAICICHIYAHQQLTQLFAMLF